MIPLFGVLFQELPRFFIFSVEKAVNECILFSFEKQGGSLSFLHKILQSHAKMPFLPKIP